MSTMRDDASGAQPKALPSHREMLIRGIPDIFFHDRRVVVGGILLVVMIFAAVVGPQLVPYDPHQPDLQDRFAAPSVSHWMGTDRNGRDLLARVILGAATSFKVAVGAAVLALVIGAPLGAVTSYIGGIVDDITQRFMDAIIAFPARLLAIVLIVLLGPSVVSLWFAIAFSSIPHYARIIRSSVLDQKEKEYVEAAHAIGEGRLAILFLYILPNVFPPMAMQVTLDFASAVTVEASLSFLGLGLVAPTISWGGLLNDAQQWLETAPWLAIFPGAALALTVLSFVLIGDALRDHMDPRTRHRGMRRLSG